MSCTDGEWICARCMEYQTSCSLCKYDKGALLIKTPQSIKDKERETYERHERITNASNRYW